PAPVRRGRDSDRVIGDRRWVLTATAVGVAGGIAATALAVSRWQEGRFERAAALRIAATTAAYLAVVVPAASDSTDFDLSKLLVQARALTTLPGRTSAVEVYHGTAPLVDATAPPLPAAALAAPPAAPPTGGSSRRGCCSRKRRRACPRRAPASRSAISLLWSEPRRWSRRTAPARRRIGCGWRAGGTRSWPPAWEPAGGCRC